MSQQQDLVLKIVELLKYLEVLEGDEKTSHTLDELSKRWGVDADRARGILRKLRREGFVRRTRSGRYKLTLAAKVLIRIYKRVKR
uniref:Transcription regulator TrmB N-terminal domain-containing protein n=1 Tax=Ignisphaera aggregans TaxID=334771 RepID=A0A7J2T8F8_9CREN